VLNCKEVSRLVSSDELENVGAVKRFRARLHLLMCRECRRYAEQLRIIGTAAREIMRNLVGQKETITRLEKAILDDAIGTKGQNR
jgi:hypothetical protein